MAATLPPPAKAPDQRTTGGTATCCRCCPFALALYSAVEHARSDRVWPAVHSDAGKGERQLTFTLYLAFLFGCDHRARDS